MEQIRLQKFFTDCDILSRRATEQAIKDGKVLVNGIPAEVGQKIDPDSDIIEYEGKVIKPPKNSTYAYIMLNKPRGFLSTVTDDRGRRCVTELVADVGIRLYPIGRLDMDSEGLLLLTNDGDLTYQLTHPKHEIPKIYHVTVAGCVSSEQKKALESPMDIDGYRILPVKTQIIEKQADKTTLCMTLYEGRNRQIRKMCEQQKLKVLTLRRVAIGTLKLDGLPLGKWKHLTKEQVNYLKQNKEKDTKSC